MRPQPPHIQRARNSILRGQPQIIAGRPKPEPLRLAAQPIHRRLWLQPNQNIVLSRRGKVRRRIRLLQHQVQMLPTQRIFNQRERHGAIQLNTD